MSELKVDAVAIQEANFPVKTVNGKDEHQIPEIRGWNIVARPRQTGRKTGTNSAGRGGVAWLIKEGLNYEILKTSPVIPSDTTTEWTGIRIFQEDNGKVAGHVDLWNLYIPPIHESSKDDDRRQLFDTGKLSTDQTITTVNIYE